MAEQGDAGAQYSLGWMYDQGLGVIQNYKQAAYWYRLAAKQGQADSLYNLGIMYANGWGVTQGYNKAVRLYRLAAKQGNSSAPFNLGVMYDKGQGVIQNHVQAHKWFNIAGALGEEKGSKARGLIEKRMTPDQIAEAQRLAQEYMKKHSKAMVGIQNDIRATTRQPVQQTPVQSAPLPQAQPQEQGFFDKLADFGRGVFVPPDVQEKHRFDQQTKNLSQPGVAASLGLTEIQLAVLIGLPPGERSKALITILSRKPVAHGNK